MGTEIQTVKNQMTLKNWEQEVAECQSSGMTVSAWSELHGINVKTYYYHLRRGSGKLAYRKLCCSVEYEKHFG